MTKQKKVCHADSTTETLWVEDTNKRIVAYPAYTKLAGERWTHYAHSGSAELDLHIKVIVTDAGFKLSSEERDKAVRQALHLAVETYKGAGLHGL